ncbi:PASTA domain-containing protein [Kribbella speibonae]|uniref:PASTA domain-containing protein n=1 Tax=Kribbella speibonae TaxID=1572660 RepID=A0ABY2A301_9ACTN|nr:PASTA domain-containing protein [Kribbella speibonae]TCC20340.1 PASTA domain-containing protein [Kribbella speibonae]
MTDLTDLLARTADQTPVGPPPLDALHAGATRRRRRRTAGLTATAAVAVAAVIGGTTLLTSHEPTTPVTSRTPTPTTPVAPATRLIGFGHAAIAVPANWPTNKSRCGTPQQDTVLLHDPTAVLFCLAFRPAGVESVGLYYGRPRGDFHADETFEIDGVRAERQRTTCVMSKYPKANTPNCGGIVSIPSLKLWFQADSSTSAEEVERMLGQIRIVPDQSGVPSYWMGVGPPTGPLVADYLPLLTAAGLKAQYKRVQSPNAPAGTILGVSPAVGTMLPVGSSVTVTVVK